MRFATYHEDDSLRVGVVEGDRLIPAVTASPAMGTLIQGGLFAAMRLDLDRAAPLLFSKHTSAVNGPADPIEWDDDYTHQVDWEAELAVVIGKAARRIAVADAVDHVFGHAAANDVSARDLQFGDGQWLRGKSLESFMPLAPVIVSPDQLGDPQSLELECRVNGVIKQNSNTGEMYHHAAELISYCSQAFTLVPGDNILTGTPAGVGVFRDPPEFLSDGDLVEVEIENIGALSNPCRTSRG